MKARKQRTQKLAVNMFKKGEIRYQHAYTANEAAKIATKWARDGWKTEVKAWDSQHLKMKCEPAVKGSRTVAKCSINTPFKKQIKGLAS